LLNDNLDFKNKEESLNKLVLKEKDDEIGILMLMEKFVEIRVEAKILRQLIMKNDLSFISYYIHDYILNLETMKVLTEEEQRYFLQRNKYERALRVSNNFSMLRYIVITDKGIKLENTDNVMNASPDEKEKI
jgi:hypothetical protein